MKLLIIEDEYSLADAISEFMKKENFEVTIITDGEKGEDEALTGLYDLIILDVMLPGKNGFEILNKIKSEKVKTPIIMLTAKSEIDDKLNGLERGADDYLTKPFNMRELIVRSKNLIKRSNKIEETDILKFGDLIFDLKTCVLKCNDNQTTVTGKEYALLELFFINKNIIMNKALIINRIWGYESDVEYNNVEVYISFLRKKLKLLKTNVNIKSVRGIGYKLEVLK